MKKYLVLRIYLSIILLYKIDLLNGLKCYSTSKESKNQINIVDCPEDADRPSQCGYLLNKTGDAVLSFLDCFQKISDKQYSYSIEYNRNVKSYLSGETCNTDLCNTEEKAIEYSKYKCFRNYRYDSSRLIKEITYPEPGNVKSVNRCFKCDECSIEKNGTIQICDKDSVCEINIYNNIKAATSNETKWDGYCKSKGDLSIGLFKGENPSRFSLNYVCDTDLCNNPTKFKIVTSVYPCEDGFYSSSIKLTFTAYFIYFFIIILSYIQFNF